MVPEAGLLFPARAAPYFNKAGADRYPEREPAEEPQHDARRRRPPISRRAQKNSQKRRLEQLRLPPIRIEGRRLGGVDD